MSPADVTPELVAEIRKDIEADKAAGHAGVFAQDTVEGILDALELAWKEAATWKRVGEDSERGLAQAERAIVVLANWRRNFLGQLGALVDAATNGRGSFQESLLAASDPGPTADDVRLDLSLYILGAQAQAGKAGST